MDNPQKKKVNICQNHLGEFFEAIKEGNLSLVEKLEHNLTPSEECVACAYVFKTNGTVREALANYLNKDGFEIETQFETSKARDLVFWGVKIAVFCAVFAGVYLTENAVRKLIIGGNFVALNLSIAEYLLIMVVSVVLFLVLDDRFLE